uniref:Galactosylgalactosylxylosylprotein 3-beta-glucuronosyltransferase n=1 Tax=Hirondellea gigas TaxID=1518452 RepID=A0A2P2I7G4_9CRUS
MRLRHFQWMLICILLSLQFIQLLRYIQGDDNLCQIDPMKEKFEPKIFDWHTLLRIRDILRRNHNRLLEFVSLRNPTELEATVNNSDIQLEDISELKPLLDRMTKTITGSRPVVYVVTATVKKPQQKAELTRLAQTLMHLDFVYWIVVEDAKKTSPSIATLLKRTGLPYHHAAATRPDLYKGVRFIGRGVFNRRAALDWLREQRKEGVLYFADDDNTYHIDLFKEIQKTKNVSVFPVGMILDLGVSSPIIRNHSVIGFHDGFQFGREFAVDMAGFAVNLQLIHQHPRATIPLKVAYLEDGFLKSLEVTMADLEPLAKECTEVLVWHTQTKLAATPNISHVDEEYMDTNLIPLYHNIL